MKIRTLEEGLAALASAHGVPMDRVQAIADFLWVSTARSAAQHEAWHKCWQQLLLSGVTIPGLEVPDAQ